MTTLVDISKLLASPSLRRRQPPRRVRPNTGTRARCDPQPRYRLILVALALRGPTTESIEFMSHSRAANVPLH
jgi:hypothetical protein